MFNTLVFTQCFNLKSQSLSTLVKMIPQSSVSAKHRCAVFGTQF